MTNQDFLKIIDQNHNHLVELMSANRTAINGDIKASSDMIQMELKSIQGKQDKTNGKVVNLEVECEKQRGFRRIFPYKLIGAIAISIILAVVVHQFGILELLNIIK